MAWRVIANFTDLRDNNYPYSVGDTYPRKGLYPDAARIFELSTDANIQGVALIEEVQDEPISGFVADTVTEPETGEPVEYAPKQRGRKPKSK